MNLPKKLRIGGLDWKVEYSNHIANEGQCYGSNHAKTQSIFLDPDTTQQHIEEVLLHEVLHAVFWRTGLWERFKNSQITEEEVIAALSPCLHQVLKENKLEF